MKILKYIFSLIPGGGSCITKAEAASLIRRFISGENLGDYEWDPFENAPITDPEVEVAREVCLFYARKFPSRWKTEYCGDEANKYFLAAANALESGEIGKLQDLNLLTRKLMNDEMPTEIDEIIKKYLAND